MNYFQIMSEDSNSNQSITSEPRNLAKNSTMNPKASALVEEYRNIDENSMDAMLAQIIDDPKEREALLSFSGAKAKPVVNHSKLQPTKSTKKTRGRPKKTPPKKVAGVKVENGKVVVDDVEQTTTANIYAIGDVIPQLELTPVAIQAGQLLARRLYAGAERKMDYTHIPTTVFTPLEYGACGLSEEDADKLLGRENVEVFSSRYGALEQACTEGHMPAQRSWCFTHNNLRTRKQRLAAGLPFEDFEKDSYDQLGRSKQYMKQNCLAKLVCDKTQNNKVVGFHYLGPDAGEVTQGFALAIKLGATKEDFDNLVGIHPTCAEEFTLLKVSRSSGEDFMKSGGC